MSLPPSPPEPAARTNAPVRLPAQCVGAAAGSLHAALITGLAADPRPALDGSAVETIGQGVLQVLLAARATDPAWCVQQPSPALCERVAALGLSDALGLPLPTEAGR